MSSYNDLNYNDSSMRLDMTFKTANDLALRKRAKAVIPNGMYGHMSTMFLHEDVPQFLTRGKGAYMWDADGNRYVDYMCGWGPILFGYADETIDGACIDRLNKGESLTGPTELMVELAEEFTSMITNADWAMFCKNGTDANTIALMAARNYRGKKTIIRAKDAYHGAAPWCNNVHPGTIDEDRAHQIFCDYNDVASLEAAVAAAGSDLAAIFATPIKHDSFMEQEGPSLAYARKARELCDLHDAILIVDQVRTGFRIARGCSWSEFGVYPDVTTWGKAIGNGHPISAVLGSDKVRHAAGHMMTTGSYWFSGAPMAASLATLKMIRETDYLERMNANGERLRAGLDEIATRHGYSLSQSGPVTMPQIMFNDDQNFAKGYCWGRQLLERGVYFHPWHNMYLSAAMTAADIDFTLEAADSSFKALSFINPTQTPEPLAKLHAIMSHFASGAQ